MDLKDFQRRDSTEGSLAAGRVSPSSGAVPLGVGLDDVQVLPELSHDVAGVLRGHVERLGVLGLAQLRSLMWMGCAEGVRTRSSDQQRPTVANYAG